MKAQRQIISILCIVMACGWSACFSTTAPHVASDTTINKKTSYNNLFLDSTVVIDFLQQDSTFKLYDQQYLDFYRHRNFEYAWFDSSGLSEQARNFHNLLNNTIEEQQDSSLYSPQFEQLMQHFADKNSTTKSDQLQTELYLTGQFFAYANKVYKGTDLDVTQLGWFIPRKKINLSELLDTIMRTKGSSTDQYVFLNPQYQKLQTQLVFYTRLQKQASPWDSIATPSKSLHINDSARIIAQIKERLFQLGDLTENDSTRVFDSSLYHATRQFQKRMGLGVDGAIGAKMIAELNVPLHKRIRQILVNMERMRWLPAEIDSNYLLINIPDYKLFVYENSKEAFSMNVIVGTAANNTVIFTGKLQYVVFAPYWNVPSSIVTKEIMPGMAKNPDYLAAHNMEITGYAGKEPIIRQKQGPGNSLGKVKFLFPNTYNIYLHDTPNRDLFSQSNRSFSHGCIRVSEPQKLAEYLLRDQQARWPKDSIVSAMNAPKEKWETLKKPIPVIISYFTAWVDEDGNMNFRKDIYKHDEKMAEKLFAK